MTTMKEFAAANQITAQTSSDLGWDDWARHWGVPDSEWNRSAHWYSVALCNGRTHRKLVLPPFGTGTAHDYVPPVEDVLSMWAGIAVDAENADDFEDWASTVGRTDDDQAAADYAEVRRVAGKLRDLLGGEVYEALLYKTERE